MKELTVVSIVVVHHLGGEIGGRSNEKYLSDVRSYHMRKRRFMEIGYHAVSFPDGEVKTGRSLSYMGAHTKGHNHNSFGIGMAGNFSKYEIGEKQLIATVDAVVKVCIAFGLSHDDVFGHRELTKTECPGKNIDMNYFRRLVRERLHAHGNKKVP